MTLDETIKHAEEVMNENLEKTKGRNASDPIAINCFECAEEHRQLAEWLKDYKRLLEQEPWEDCIGREETKQFLYERIDRLNDDELYDIFSKIIDDMYNELPPVTPQSKIGHWIGHREHCENLGVMPSGLGAYEWCSNCDCGIDVREWHRNNYNFCPNCGAKMGVEE